MKMFFKQFLLLPFIAASFCLSAQNSPADYSQESMIDALERMIDSLGRISEKNLGEKEIDINGCFQQIRISGDVTVFLTNGPTNKLWLKGDLYNLDRVKVNVRNGTLTVNAQRKTRSKLDVHVSIAGIASLIVDGDTEIFSSGTIMTKDLHIVLNGTSMVSVKYHGGLNVIAGERAELIDIGDYKKLVSRK